MGKKKIPKVISNQGDVKRDKFYAWLGKVLSTGVRSADFKNLKAMYDKGISAETMIKELDKPHVRRIRK